MSIIAFSVMSRNARNGENSESGKNRQMVCQNLHEVVRGAPHRVEKLTKNGESGKNWPWVWQILKLDDKSGLLESGGYDKNGE